MGVDATALAVRGGDALVGAMGTDGWSAVRDRVALLWAGGDPVRGQLVADQLNGTCQALHSGRTVRSAAAGLWRGRVAGLLRERPGTAVELAEILDEVQFSWGGPVSSRGRGHPDQERRAGERHPIGVNGPLIAVAVIAVLLVAAGWIAQHVVLLALDRL